MSDARVVLPGSNRQAAPGAEKIGSAPPSDQAHVTVYVRGKNKPLPITQPGHYITNEEYTAAYGASASDFMAIRDFAKKYNLTPADENASTRSIKLYGTVADLSRAFGVTLDTVKIGGKTYRHREGDITIPENLLPIITAVLGLDNRPNAEPHVKKINPQTVAEAVAAQSFSPLAIGQLYDFPANLDGTGQIIAIIELDGGYLQSDLDAYFQGLNLKTPTITAVSVDGGQNKVPTATQPPVPTSAELEVALDIQIAGALAPGATQLVYFSGTSDQAFLDAINTAIVATPQPTVISISWGKAESGFTAQMRQQFETALQHAAQLGIPVCVASGDNGSFDGTSALAVDFPASAPHALGCGGTNLLVSGSTISSETVWNAVVKDASGNSVRQGSGGGVSQFFPLPTYQSTVTVPAQPTGTGGGRGVPDVAGDADPATGYQIRCKGANTIVGGTSAVAPLWAALIARFGQKIGKPVGFLNTLIYQSGVAASCFRDVAHGNNDSTGKNGLYQAAKGWDPCTGFGSPRGASLLTKLTASAPPTPNSDPNPNSHPDTDPNPNSDAYTHPNSDSDPHTNTNPAPNADSNTHSDANPASNADSNADSNTDSNTDSNPNPASNADSNTHSDANTSPNADSNTHSDANTSSNADPDSSPHSDANTSSNADPDSTPHTDANTASDAYAYAYAYANPNPNANSNSNANSEHGSYRRFGCSLHVPADAACAASDSGTSASASASVPVFDPRWRIQLGCLGWSSWIGSRCRSCCSHGHRGNSCDRQGEGMNDIKALLTRLVQNPDLVKSLKDPQALGQLAGLGEDKLKALAGVGNVLSGFLGGRRKSPVPKAHTPRDAGSSGSGSSGGARNTALVGTVSLTAIAGAVAALGTVSVVALSKGRKVSQS